MPRDVTMHSPRAWVVRFESEDQVAARWQQGDVAARWVDEGKICEVGYAPVGCGGLFENNEIVAVEVDLWRSLVESDRGRRVW